MLSHDNEILSGEYLCLPMQKVYFGPSSLDQLPLEVERLGTRRAFVITGKTIARQTTLIERIRHLLGDSLAGVFSNAQQHVPSASVIAAAEQALAVRADLLVSVGGGSAIDTARGVAIALATNSRSTNELAEYRARFTFPRTIEIPPLPFDLTPHIAVPTTLSAAEFANAGAITSEERRVKDLFIADSLTPRSVVLDPEITLHTPLSLWLATGMRAIDHAVETVYSPRHQPVTDTLSLQAIHLLATNLRLAKEQPENLFVRQQAQFAAWMSYFGEMNLTLGLSHAIGHQLGPKHNVPHGVTSAIVLPQVMRFLAQLTAKRQVLIARALGVLSPEHDPQSGAEAAAVAIEDLVDDLDLPRSLRDVGVGPESYDDIAQGVMQDLVVTGSPRPIQGPEDIVAVLQAAA